MLRWALWLAALTVSINAFADNSAADAWHKLEKSAFAARELNYEGQFVYVNGKLSRRVQITHMNHGGHEVARNIVMDDSHREVYSHGRDIMILQPSTNNVVIKKRRGQNLFPAMLPTDLTQIKSHYTPEMVGTEFVADREAYVIALNPIDKYRYAYKVWSDVKFGLILKMALLDTNSKTLEQIYFDQLSMLNSHDMDWFKPKIDISKRYVTEHAPNVEAVADEWVVTKLPPGYKKVDHIKRAVNGRKKMVDQLVFSDGIGSVSVFIEPLVKGVRPKKGHIPMGSTNMCADVVDGHQVIVVGEVPVQTVKSIAKAVSFTE